MTKKHHPGDHSMSRRDVLRGAGVMAGGLLAGRLPLDQLLAGPPRAAANGDRPKVALAEARAYSAQVIRRRVQDMLDALGGLGDVVGSGDRVVIKTNLTGGTYWRSQIDVPAVESFVTHPAVMRALCEAVLDAGAGEVYIVEAVYEAASFTDWGYRDMAGDLGVTLIDLNRPTPYRDFTDCAVGQNWLIYETLKFNNILTEADVFMSVAKLKCHATAGVTLSMKNLVGLVPAAHYGLEPGDSTRTAMHGHSVQSGFRIPSVIMDLVHARPIDFALIDGIRTSEFAEGPWQDGWKQVRPGVLVAGKNAVATDAVSTALMGFDPAAESLTTVPFRWCLNHLQLANYFGMGPNDLAGIEIVGESLEAMRYPFAPFRNAWE